MHSCDIAHAPFRWTSWQRSKSSIDVARPALRCITPALFTTMSMRPERASPCRTAFVLDRRGDPLGGAPVVRVGQVGEQDMRSTLRQRNGNAFADPAARAGHDRNLD
jgi:hypothetical protein